MTRLVHCKKLDKELPGLTFRPFKGELGERIFLHISEEAWRLWLGQSTMVINEQRLNPAEPAAQKILLAHLEQFLFGDGGKVPAGWRPPPPR